MIKAKDKHFVIKYCKTTMQQVILAMESSCDETSVAIMEGSKLVSHVITSQKIHAGYGGVVPELASRAHQKSIVPVVKQALEKACIQLSEVTAVAFTQGPGLLGSLLVGACFAKGLGYALGVPLVGVHHMKAHVLASFIEEPKPTFPFLALVVSGGHTQLIVVKDYLQMELLGQTRDDAMGEAFDKMAKMMGLPYPGGVWIDRYAQEGDATKFTFPTTTVPHLDFSFSGIKTAFLYFLQDQKKKDPHFVERYRNDLCASIQASLVDMVIKKVQKALQYTGVSQVVLGGGVASNSSLRDKLNRLSLQQGFQLFIPKREYCTDNAAMIGITAYHQVLAGNFCHYDAPSLARMPL